MKYREVALSELVGRSDEDLFPPDIAAKFRADDELILETGKTIKKYEENVDRDGKRIWTEIIKGPLRDADENIVGVQILLWDSTDRHEAERALERERHLLHTLLDNVPDSIYFKDRESKFVRVSKGMAEKFHLENPESVIGKSDADIFTSEHALQARKDEVQIMETLEPVIGSVEKETWPGKPDTWCSTTKLPLQDSSGAVIGTFGISRDITELKNAELQLREARDAADRANAAKSQFLANMSHEIRTPMNGILGMSELLRHTRLQDDQRSFLEMIDHSAKSLLRIINDILDFSKVEAGKLELENRPFELRRCVTYAAKSLAARAAQKSLDLILEIDPDLGDHFVGDADRLRQVLVNLVGNAIKFTQEGEIKIAVRDSSRPQKMDSPLEQDEVEIHFSVSDTGLGIEEAKQSTIFEAFAQADLSTTREFGGTGLGLSISIQLVEMMGGEMWLDSELGVGSTFHFTVRFQRGNPENNASLPEDLTFLRQNPILLLDASDSSQEQLKEALERHRAQVSTASNLADAIVLCSEMEKSGCNQCIVVLDESIVNLGFDPVIHLQASDHYEPLLVIVSPMVNPLRYEGIQSTFNASIVQSPALPAEIIAAINQVLNKQSSQSSTDSQPLTEAKEPLGLNFLLAEDGAVNRAVITGLLERQGHNVACAEDGLEALELWRKNKFDAILMDIQMPHLDGLQATKQIRKEEADSGMHVPIIALTAAAMVSDRDRCIEAGMDDYLSKPIDFDEFERVIEAIQSAQTEHPSSTEDTDATHDAAACGKQESVTQPDTCFLSGFAPTLSGLHYTNEQRFALVETFRTEAEERLEELARALETDDADLFIRASHSLKSAAAMFRAHRVVELAGRLENEARKGNCTVYAVDCKNLETATRAMLKDVEQWLSENATDDS